MTERERTSQHDAVPVLTTPPSLPRPAPGADVGLCADGYCVLPPSRSADTD